MVNVTFAFDDQQLYKAHEMSYNVKTRATKRKVENNVKCRDDQKMENMRKSILLMEAGQKKNNTCRGQPLYNQWKSNVFRGQPYKTNVKTTFIVDNLAKPKYTHFFPGTTFESVCESFF